MAAKPPCPALKYLKPIRYKAGLPLWHQHKYVLNTTTGLYEFPPDAFFANCPYRFSGKLAAPARAMWYAGGSASCALWETILRDRFPNARGHVDIPPGLIAGRILTPCITTVELNLIELMPGPLRMCAGSQEIFDAWHHLTITPDHAETHAPAAAVLDAAVAAAPPIAIDGFVWYSRQAGNADNHPLACALFQPPCGTFFDLDPTRAPINLDHTEEGWRAIDKALAQARMTRRGVTPQDDDDLAS
ncbi:MAG: RES domain-containing protein [Sulfuricaulis sp.]